MSVPAVPESESLTQCGKLLRRGFQTAAPSRCRKPATHEVVSDSGIVHGAWCEQHAKETTRRHFGDVGVVVRLKA